MTRSLKGRKSRLAQTGNCRRRAAVLCLMRKSSPVQEVPENPGHRRNRDHKDPIQPANGLMVNGNPFLDRVHPRICPAHLRRSHDSPCPGSLLPANPAVLCRIVSSQRMDLKGQVVPCVSVKGAANLSGRSRSRNVAQPGGRCHPVGHVNCQGKTLNAANAGDRLAPIKQGWVQGADPLRGRWRKAWRRFPVTIF